MAVLTRFDTVSGLTVQNLIKSNTYTETYRVQDQDANPYFLKLFILKKMPQKLINEQTGIVREIEYCQQINNRNIISCIASGSLDNSDGAYQYYITNYFNGQVLSDVLATKGAFEEGEALRIFEGILNGLHYLHTLSGGLCHNDLDTSNIILSSVDSGEPVIIDLGHLSPRCYGNTNFDTSDLNPIFHAHETNAGIFDEQGDIFSACAVLYSMLAGTPPWTVDLPAEGSYKEKFTPLIRHRKSHPVSFSNLKISKKTEYIIERGLERDTSKRFESVQALLDFLKSASEPAVDVDKSEERPKPNHRTSDSDVEQSLDSGLVIKRGGGNGFKDIAGMQPLKDYLYRQVIFVLKDRESAEKYRLLPPNGMLLYGPPGCGKTYFAEKFAEETGFNFLLIKASDLGSTYVHGTQEKISNLFKEAEKSAPIVLCFDEFDAFVPDRSAFGMQHQAGEVNEFLSQMNNCAKRGIFIVATSNRPDKIDPAVLRTGRIDKMVYVPMPDEEARREMFKLYLDKRPVSDDINVVALAKLTDGYIASDIAFIVNDASMAAAYSRALITQSLLETSIENIKPSLRLETLEQYDHIKDRMESTNRTNNIRNVVEGL